MLKVVRGARGVWHHCRIKQVAVATSKGHHPQVPRVNISLKYLEVNNLISFILDIWLSYFGFYLGYVYNSDYDFIVSHAIEWIWNSEYLIFYYE